MLALLTLTLVIRAMTCHHLVRLDTVCPECRDGAAPPIVDRSHLRDLLRGNATSPETDIPGVSKA